MDVLAARRLEVRGNSKLAGKLTVLGFDVEMRPGRRRVGRPADSYDKRGQYSS